jgi:hypothetical protein
MTFHGTKYRTRLKFAARKYGWSKIARCWSPIPMRTFTRASAAAGARAARRARAATTPAMSCLVSMRQMSEGCPRGLRSTHGGLS